MSKVTETVWNLAQPLAAEQGVELWDVEYVKEAGQWFLRVYLDKDGGIGINDCEAFPARWIPSWTTPIPSRAATCLR